MIISSFFEAWRPADGYVGSNAGKTTIPSRVTLSVELLKTLELLLNGCHLMFCSLAFLGEMTLPAPQSRRGTDTKHCRVSVGQAVSEQGSQKQV